MPQIENILDIPMTVLIRILGYAAESKGKRRTSRLRDPDRDQQMLAILEKKRAEMEGRA